MRFVSLFSRHATAANLLMVLVLSFGLYAAGQMRAQFMPDVVSEEITVSIAWENASAEDVSESLISVISPSLMTLDGLDELSAIARDERARFSLTFEPDWDMEKAIEDVESALPSSASLPDSADDPEVERGAWRDRVFDMVVSGDYPAARMEEIGLALEQELLRSGLTSVELRGATTPEISVVLSAGRLAEHGLTLSGLAETISGNVRDGSIGEIESANTPVRAGANRLSIEGLSNLTIDTSTGLVRLSEIADIKAAEAGSERAFFLEGHPAVSVSVQRGAQGDALEIQDNAMAVAQAFVDRLPEDLSITLIRNQAKDIEARLAILIDNAAFGLILVLIILLVFLSPSAAVWVAAGIPIATAAGMGLMWLTGQSLNMISMFALLICLGIIVDDAIVVAESAEYRRRSRGESRMKAAERAAQRMLAPILASTVTTVVAFMSLQSIGGRFGEFIATIPLVVAAVLMASLLECFLILPRHLGHGLASLDQSFLAWPSIKVNALFERLRDKAFKPIVRSLIAGRYAILLLALAATLQGAAMIMNRDVAWRFFDAPQDTTISANIAMRDEATRADTEEMLAEMLRAATVIGAEFEIRYGVNPISVVLTEIGGTSGPGLATADDKDVDLLGSLSIEVIDSDERPYETDSIVQAFEGEMIRPALLETFSFRAGRRGPGGDGLDIALYGYDPENLDMAAEDLKAILAGFPELTGLEDDLTMGSESQVLALTDLGMAMGFDESSLASELRARLSGVEATTFQQGNQTGSILVEIPDEDISSAYLEEILLQSPTGRWVELGEIVTVSSDPSIKVIRSQSGQSVVRVTGEVSTEDALRAEEVLSEIQSDILPEFVAERGLGFEMRGLAQQEQEFLSDAVVGYGICLLLIYMTLVLVLGRWLWPLSIMAVIPVGLTGVIWGHYWWDMSLSIFSIVGFVGMSGIIVNDSIVLITAILERQKEIPVREAIIEATAERLRPVLLTTLTTVLGLAPLLLETSSQAEFLKPMVVTLCFGLSFGFLIVLLVVPALISIQDDIGRMFGRALKKC